MLPAVNGGPRTHMSLGPYDHKAYKGDWLVIRQDRGRADGVRRPARPGRDDAATAVSDFWKYHGLGNDYLVLEPARFAAPITPEGVRVLCERHRGVGSDGILWGPLPGRVPPAVRIFNPDGSEAERSGNGLRIFARHLRARGLAPSDAFAIDTVIGPVQVRLLDATGHTAALAMGAVRFDSAAIPMTGPPREVLREHLAIGGRDLVVSAANVGNPHCVVLVDDPTPALAASWGRSLERYPELPGANERPVRGGPRSALHPHRDLGARRRLHRGVGHEQLRRGGRRLPARARGLAGHGRDAGRDAPGGARRGLPRDAHR